MKHHALKLYDYHVWANKQVFDRLKELPHDIWNKEIQSVFPSISAVMMHIYLTDTTWLGVMRGDKFEDIVALVTQLRDATKAKSMEEIEAMCIGLSRTYIAFLESQEDLDRAASCNHPRFGRLDTRLPELVQHVCNHGTFHRGNISAMLHQLGHSGTPTDYIFYLYENQV